MGPELLRGHILLFSEDPVKIGEVVETALKADLRDCFVGINKQP